MKRSMFASALLLGSLSAGPVLAEDAAKPPEDTGPFAAKNFTGTVNLTTNYMFRGISNSNGPAIQGSLDYSYNGFFAGVWGSNTEFSDSHLELDYYGGYRWSMVGLDFTLQGIVYTWPGDNPKSSLWVDAGAVTRANGQPLKDGIDTNYGEVNLGVSKTFNLPLAPVVGLNYFYSPNGYGEDGDSHTVQGNFTLTLPEGIGLYGTVGYNSTEGDKTTGLNGAFPTQKGGFEYVYFQAGANYTVKGFKLDLSYVGTDESKELSQVYPLTLLNASNEAARHLITGEIVFSISRTF